METEKTNAKNELIHTFMGEKSYVTDGWVKMHKILKYHEDWNWLMRVVEKIEDTIIEGFVAPGKQKIVLTTDRKMVYNQVVQFIEWYNEQNN